MPTLGGGGAERVAVNLLHATPMIDWEAAVWRGGGVFQDDLPPDIPLHVLGGRRLRWAGARLRKLLEARRPDVLVSSQWQAGILAARAAPRGLPWISWEHSGDVPERPWLLRRYLVRLYNHRASGVVCVSDQLCDQLADAGVKRGRLLRIYNPVVTPQLLDAGGCSLPEHPWFANGPVLLAVGRLVPQKGYDVLLKAMAIIRSARPEAKLVVLGEGPLRGELMTMADRSGLSGCVQFMGFQRNPYPFIANSSAFVMASRREGLPTVLIEALACGTPIVSTDCPTGPREILQGGECGLLVAPEDPQGLADAVLRVLSDPRLRQQLIEAGRRRARDFSVERAAAFVHVIEEAVRDGR